jgi:hypothetical protein
MLKETPPDMGVEVDLRYSGNQLILHHDPFKDGEAFEDFLSSYSHKFIILDIKSEGIEKRAIEAVENAGIVDYFLLNVNFPVIVKLARSGFRKMSMRFSDFESLDTCFAFRNKAEFVWVESFERFTLSRDIHTKLKDFKISLVSPELYGRAEEIGAYRRLLPGDVHSVCTDYPEKWL